MELRPLEGRSIASSYTSVPCLAPNIQLQSCSNLKSCGAQLLHAMEQLRAASWQPMLRLRSGSGHPKGWSKLQSLQEVTAPSAHGTFLKGFHRLYFLLSPHFWVRLESESRFPLTTLLLWTRHTAVRFQTDGAIRSRSCHLTPRLHGAQLTPHLFPWRRLSSCKSELCKRMLSKCIQWIPSCFNSQIPSLCSTLAAWRYFQQSLMPNRGPVWVALSGTIRESG